MTLDPSNIGASTEYIEWINHRNYSDITVAWDPPECEGTLQIAEVEPIQGYVPPDAGVLQQDSGTPNLWRYTAFDEPATELCPASVKVWIAAMQGELELTRKSVLVLPVHDYLTTGPNANLGKDYVYLSLKYGDVLATTGGVFDGVQISTEPLVVCSGVVGYACTSWGPIAGYTVVFGANTFTGSENQAVSIIGHELMHTAAGLMAGECPAYQWEADHAQQTGTALCDLPYLQTINDYLDEPTHECP